MDDRGVAREDGRAGARSKDNMQDCRQKNDPGVNAHE